MTFWVSLKKSFINLDQVEEVVGPDANGGIDVFMASGRKREYFGDDAKNIATAASGLALLMADDLEKTFRQSIGRDLTELKSRDKIE
jgi:hypothetical protein